ncbi:MAG: ribosome maturation factor RimP [Candidatus Sericytochromatia bacterium]|nr:ribosome maturation factor RimP [Candidatus Sericytochromatia bacterium]
MSVKDILFQMAEPVVQQEGFELVELEYAKEGPRWVVRVFLYAPEGVSLDDCQRVSDALSTRFDADDPVKTPYHLEVSSPGAERVLKTDREFRIFAGRLVRLTLSEPVDVDDSGKKVQVLHGLLEAVTEESVALKGEKGHTITLPRGGVKQVRLALKSSAPAFN